MVPVAKRLEMLGAPPFDDAPGWVDRALRVTTRKVRHPGNHKYVWTLDRVATKVLPGHLWKMGLAPTWHPQGPFARDYPKETAA